MNKDPRGHEVLADVDARITEFTDRIGDAYREQEARFSGFVDEVKDAVDDAADAVKSTAPMRGRDRAPRPMPSTPSDAAKSAAKKLTD